MAKSKECKWSSLPAWAQTLFENMRNENTVLRNENERLKNVIAMYQADKSYEGFKATAPRTRN